MNEIHEPVLLEQSVRQLIVDRSGVYFDATLGFGGHSTRFLKELEQNGTLVATDVDKEAFKHCIAKFSTDSRTRLYNYNFSKIDVVAKIESIGGFDGIFADLGVSSFQLDNKDSGFSYRMDADLDLRMDKTRPISAADVVNEYDMDELVRIFSKYGEERKSKTIARKIVEQRVRKPLRTTKDLAVIIEESTPPQYRFKSLSRVFQALRIYVNDELGVLKDFLQSCVKLLHKNGRLVVISYHSLEDRIVKEFLKYEELECICPPEFPVCVCDKQRRLISLTRKPIVPDNYEIERNPRARSAKMRVAERV